MAMPELALTRRCQNGWALQHYFINATTLRPIPARCKSWRCAYCAPLNAFKVGLLAEVGKPERFITLTRAPSEKSALSLAFAHAVQALRRRGYAFQYLAVPELHKNGLPHLHILQRGDFIPHSVVSEVWEVATQGYYHGQGSFVVDIRQVESTDDAVSYVTKYMTKGAGDGSAKGWAALQARYPGMRHYRRSREWGNLPLSPDMWLLAHQSRLDEFIAALRTGAFEGADYETYYAILNNPSQNVNI